MDDLIHEDGPSLDVPSTPRWSENFCFCWHDPDTHIGMWFHVGRWVHDPRLWREILTIALPNDRVLVAKSYGDKATAGVAAANFLSVHVIEPGKTFRLKYHGPAWERSRADLVSAGFRDGHPELLDMDLLFEGCEPVWNMSGHGGKSEELVSSMHVEQIGKGSGSLGFKDHQYSIRNAFVNRDHSRGVRIVAGYKRHAWIQGWFPSGRGFHIYTAEMHGVEGFAMNSACITQAGKMYPAKVRSVDCPVTLNDVYKPFTIELESKLGIARIKVVKIHNSWPLSFTAPFDLHLGNLSAMSGLQFEESIECEWDHETGYGCSERGVVSDLSVDSQ